jgi:hypothetical protein
LATGAASGRKARADAFAPHAGVPEIAILFVMPRPSRAMTVIPKNQKADPRPAVSKKSFRPYWEPGRSELHPG